MVGGLEVVLLPPGPQDQGPVRRQLGEQLNSA